MATHCTSLDGRQGLLLSRSSPRECFKTLRSKHLGRQRRVGQSRSPCRSAVVFAQQNFATQLIGGAFGGPNEIFVAGADGQLGARIVQKLLQAGFKVIAGVPDRDEAQNAVNFATSVELLRKPEVQKLQLAEIKLSDGSSIAAALPKRGARVLAVVNDSAGRKATRLDAKAASRVLQAAQEVNASQFVLVSPSGSSSGGGIFGKLFGGGSGGGSGARLSSLEQEVVSAGLEFTIIRTGRTDVQDPEFATSTYVALGAQGSLPQRSQMTKGQIAQVVQQVVRQGSGDLLIEAWASEDAPESSVEDAVSEVLPSAAFGGGEDEEEFEPEEEEEEDDDADEEEAEVPKTPGGLFGGFGTRRIKAGQDAPESLQASSAAQSNGSRPQPQKRSGFRFGSQKDEDEEEEPQEKAGNALKGFFGSKKTELEQAEVSPEGARRSAARGAKAAGKRIEKAAPVPPGADPPAPPKKGFLASIGFGGDTKYVDDEE